MGRFKRYYMENYVTLDTNGSGNCLLCNKVIKAHIGNIKRHYAAIHKQIKTSEEENQSPPSSSKKRKIQYATLNMNKDEFLKCILKTVTQMHMPFSCFDNENFQKLLQPWTECYGSKFNSKSIGSLINDMAKSLRCEISSEVGKKYVCLKLDIASRMERSIMGINIQYINKNFEVIVHTIGMVELFERHHSHYLKAQVLEILEKFNIHINQIYSITTDNGANVIKTSKLLQEFAESGIENDENFNGDIFDIISSRISESLSVIHCAAHTLQLAAWDVIKLLKDKINTCRNVARTIRNQMRKSKAGPLPVLDNITR